MEKKINNILSIFFYIVLSFSIVICFALFLTYIFDLIASHLFHYISYVTIPFMFYLFCLLTFLISIIKGFFIMNKFDYNELTCENLLSLFLIYTYGTIVYNIFNIVLLCIKMESILIYFYFGFGFISLIISICLFIIYKHVKKIVRGENNVNK